MLSYILSLPLLGTWVCYHVESFDVVNGHLAVGSPEWNDNQNSPMSTHLEIYTNTDIDTDIDTCCVFHIHKPMSSERPPTQPPGRERASHDHLYPGEWETVALLSYPQDIRVKEDGVSHEWIGRINLLDKIISYWLSSYYLESFCNKWTWKRLYLSSVSSGMDVAQFNAGFRFL